MKENLLKKAHFAEQQIAGVGREASRLKEAVTDVVEETILDAKRAARRSYRAAEDIVDEAAHTVKRHPWRAVALAFGLGALIGLVIPRGRSRP